jgi:hypothetical protein
VKVTRLVQGPIISPSTHPSLGENIQGPSLIRVPEWVPEPRGRFYLYFADHKGSFIRLAFADDLVGPWAVHPPGSLQLADSQFLTDPPPATDEELDTLRQFYKEALESIDLPHDLAIDATTPHIASPDVHVDDTNQRFIMYFHGLENLGEQVTRVATPRDGHHFCCRSRSARAALPSNISPPRLGVRDHDAGVDLTIA